MRINYNLKPGDRITVLEECFGSISIRECSVVKEYPKYVEADFGPYREGINKARQRCKSVFIGKGWLSE